MKTSTVFFVGSRPCKEDATIWFVHQVYFDILALKVFMVANLHYQVC